MALKVIVLLLAILLVIDLGKARRGRSSRGRSSRGRSSRRRSSRQRSSRQSSRRHRYRRFRTSKSWRRISTYSMYRPHVHEAEQKENCRNNRPETVVICMKSAGCKPECTEIGGTHIPNVNDNSIEDMGSLVDQAGGIISSLLDNAFGNDGPPEDDLFNEMDSDDDDLDQTKQHSDEIGVNGEDDLVK